MTRRCGGVAVFAAWALAYAACGDDGPRDGGGGNFDEGSVCGVGDPQAGRSCPCIGDTCVCPESGDCALLCVDECALACAGSGNCELYCASTGCDVDCTGSGDCTVVVGAGSTVDCTGSGDCAIDCDGDCTVRCPGSGTCSVWCQSGWDCTVEDCSSPVIECPDDVKVCNGGCPG